MWGGGGGRGLGLVFRALEFGVSGFRIQFLGLGLGFRAAASDIRALGARGFYVGTSLN